MKIKLLIIFIMVSLTVHALAIVLSLRVDMPAAVKNDKVMKVDLKNSKEIEKPSVNKTTQRFTRREESLPDGAIFREASVGLENPGGVYEPYLLKIRRKIENLWLYPPQALAEGREGRAVIRFTIAANGALASSTLVSSSGSALLDGGALACIRAASPFEALPTSFEISFLHVTAAFSYRIDL